MREKAIVITNNVLSKEGFEKTSDVIFVDGSLMDVMKTARDFVHKGHKLLTHPLMGSIKPNETPYKTIAISFKAENGVNLDSLSLMENSIETSEKLIDNRPPRNWSKEIINRVYEDYRVIDFDLIHNAFNI
ncbi:GrdX family protein [Niallia sp. XMNu-256]|uniref:GrdX family protein n=1 Tax=Niallia sp. XMNu-256 TaxID=3082444 RepID=UPI0030D0E0AA